jgi:hypothetical protein
MTEKVKAASGPGFTESSFQPLCLASLAKSASVRSLPFIEFNIWTKEWFVMFRTVHGLKYHTCKSRAVKKPCPAIPRFVRSGFGGFGPKLAVDCESSQVWTAKESKTKSLEDGPAASRKRFMISSALISDQS